MKFDNPVSVPVDSILAWGGCDTEDLLDAKFHACDVADSTTGKDMALGGIGSSCGGQASLLTMDNLDSLLMHGPAHPHATSSLTPHPSTPHSNGHSFAELKPLTPYDYGPLPSLSTDLSTGSEVDAVTGSSSSSNLNANSCEPGPGGGGRTILDINLNLYKATCSSSGGGGGGGVYFSTEPVSTTSSLVNGLVSVVSGLQKEVGVAEYLMNPEIDDIAAIIGNAIADSTVNHVAVDPHQIHGPHGGGGMSMAMSMGMGMGGMGGPDLRDPWADIDAWIESACATAYKNEPMLESPGSSITSGSSLGSTAGTTVFGHHSAHRLPPGGGGGGGSSSANSGHLTSSCSVTSTLQSLLTSGLNPGASSQGGSGSGPADHAIMAIKSEPSLDMPLLQRRLTAGRGPESSSTSHYVSCSLAGKDSVPHTTSYSGSSGGPPNLNQVTTTIPHISNDTVHSSTFPRRSAPKNPPKMELDLGDDLMGPSLGGGGVGSGSSSSNKKNKSRLGKSKMTTIMTTENGKEKPVHRCNICNRGFLNKSNIKVHLRTHTGEKPFKCDACAKAFRQKAHLLKHMQIHKRITRD